MSHSNVPPIRNLKKTCYLHGNFLFHPGHLEHLWIQANVAIDRASNTRKQLLNADKRICGQLMVLHCSQLAAIYYEVFLLEALLNYFFKILVAVFVNRRVKYSAWELSHNRYVKRRFSLTSFAAFLIFRI